MHANDRVKVATPRLHELLHRYQEAWTNHDVDAIVAMMTPDCIYEASVGPEPWGERFVGREAVRLGILRLRAESAHPDTELEHHERHIFGGHAVSTWTSTYRLSDGAPVTVHGCDLYEFRDGLVARKIAFRKARSQ